MRDVFIGITAASYSGNKGAAAMLQSSIKQLHDIYGDRLNINLMSVYPGEDKKQLPYDFINITSTKPEQLLFIAFPLAVLYKLLKWCPPIKKLIAKNKILKTYLKTDLVELPLLNIHRLLVLSKIHITNFLLNGFCQS